MPPGLVYDRRRPGGGAPRRFGRDVDEAFMGDRDTEALRGAGDRLQPAARRRAVRFPFDAGDSGPGRKGGFTTCQLERPPVGACEKASVSPEPTATQRDSVGQEIPVRPSLTGIRSSSVEFSSTNAGGSCRRVQFAALAGPGDAARLARNAIAQLQVMRKDFIGFGLGFWPSRIQRPCVRPPEL